MTEGFLEGVICGAAIMLIIAAIGLHAMGVWRRPE